MTPRSPDGTRPRIGIGGIGHETNTYVSRLTELDSFHIARGQELVERTRGTQTYFGGMLAAAVELSLEVVPLIDCYAFPSGVISSQAYDACKAELLATVARNLPLDAIVLSLHGAGVAEGVDDLEADLCRALRVLVGPDVALVATFDLHGNLTQDMADQLDLLFGVHLYPHDDAFDRGQEAVRALPQLLSAAIRPVTYVERLPMLIPTTATRWPPASDINALCAELEARASVVDVTWYHGFPYTDTPLAGSCVTATTDGDRELARACAKEVASYVWSRRADLEPNSLVATEAVARALALEGRPVVINETSDNPGGGAPGDGTHLLRALIDAGVNDVCFATIVDSDVVAQAHHAGVGAEIEVLLGGKTDALHGDPLSLRCYVQSLADGRITLEAMFAGMAIDLGPTARLRVGGPDQGVDVIVATNAHQTLDRTPFLLHGVDVTQRRIIALKSSHHFRSGFRDAAAHVVTADGPGLTTLRIGTLPRTRAQGPMWPIDPAASYDPA